MRNTDKLGNLMGRWKYSVDWITLAQNMVGQQAPVNTEMNFRIPRKMDNFWTCLRISASQYLCSLSLKETYNIKMYNRKYAIIL